MNQRPKLPEQFLAELRNLESAYLAETDLIKQSGFHGGEARWRRERGLILEAVDKDGDFLDVGCANGYLVQCLSEWAREKGITLIPYGVDQGTRLIELARKRLPQYASHFWVGNAWDWIPPRRFRYVYTMTDFVPEAFLKNYLARAIKHYVQGDGLLIVGAYGSTSKNVPAQDITSLLKGFGFPVAGSATCGDLPVSHVAWTEAEQFATADAGKPRRS